jgi:peptide/nickel transport system substrate-binding protein
MVFQEERDRQSLLDIRLSRRRMMQLSAALGSGVAATTLLAACGSDDDDPTATAGTGATTTTGTEPTTTGATAEATTSGDGTAEPTSAVDASPTSGDSGSANPRHFGVPIEPAQNEGGTIVISHVGEFGLINPVPQGDGGHRLLRVVYEMLMGIHPDTKEAVPALAHSWEISDDGMLWTVFLEENVTWHDGEPFDSEDVAFTYGLHLMEVEETTIWAGIVQAVVESVTAVDTYTVEIVPTKPNAFLPFDSLEETAIVPEHILAGIALEDMRTHPAFTGEDPSLIIGTGPWRFVEVVESDHLTVARYDDYWDGRPHLDEIIFRSVPDTTAIANLLKTGELDVSGGLSASQAAEFENDETISVNTFTGSMRYIALNLDPEKTTLFQDVRVRQALLMAIDRQSLVDNVNFGYGTVADLTQAPDSWSYDPEGMTVRYPYDPEQAMALLDEAGWVVGDDGVREKDGERLAFTVYTYAGWDEAESCMAVIQEQWRQIGVEIAIELEQDSAMYERYYERSDYEAVFEAIGHGASVVHIYVWGTGGSFNRTGYSNPELDELFNQTFLATDREEQIELMNQSQEIIVTDLPLLPLYWNQQIFVYNTRIHNLYPTNHEYFFNSETWWVDA